MKKLRKLSGKNINIIIVNDMTWKHRQKHKELELVHAARAIEKESRDGKYWV